MQELPYVSATEVDLQSAFRAMCVEHVRRSETVRLSESHYSSYNGYDNRTAAVSGIRSSSSSSSSKITSSTSSKSPISSPSKSLTSQTVRSSAAGQGMEMRDGGASSAHILARSNKSFLNNISSSSVSRGASCQAETRRALQPDSSLSFREYVAAAMIRR